MRGIFRPVLALILGAVCGRVCGAEPWPVQVQTSDGSVVSGTIELGRLHIDSELGKFDVDPAQIRQIDFADGKASVRLRDSSTINGTVSMPAWKVASKLGELQIAAEKVTQIRFTGQPKPPADPNRVPGDPPTRPDAAPEPDPTEAAELKPEVRGTAGVTFVGRPILSPDGARLVFVSGDARLCALETGSLAAAGSLEAPAGALTCSVSPDGATVWVVNAGTVARYALADWKAAGSFQIEYPMHDVLAIEGDLALGFTSKGLVVLDPRKQAALGVRPGISGPVHRVEGQSRALAATGTLTWALDAGEPGGVRIGFVELTGYSTLKEPLTPSADGRFGISRPGDLYRMGRSHLAGRLPVGKVAANSCVAALRDRVLLFTADGFLKIYGMETFELTRSVQLGIHALAVLADEKAGALYLFGVKTGSRKVAPPAPGAWYRYRIP